jgi:hypothetical protein
MISFSFLYTQFALILLRLSSRVIDLVLVLVSENVNNNGDKITLIGDFFHIGP